LVALELMVIPFADVFADVAVTVKTCALGFSTTRTLKDTPTGITERSSFRMAHLPSPGAQITPTGAGSSVGGTVYTDIGATISASGCVIAAYSIFAMRPRV